MKSEVMKTTRASSDRVLKSPMCVRSEGLHPRAPTPGAHGPISTPHKGSILKLTDFKSRVPCNWFNLKASTWTVTNVAGGAAKISIPQESWSTNRRKKNICLIKDKKV